MMMLSLFLAAGVFIADTVLHYKTSTVEFDQVLVQPQPKQELGHGLNEFCLKFNRTHLGFPCSVNQDSTQADPNANAEAIERSRLFHNTSQSSEMRLTDADEVADAQLAYLIPKEQTVVPNTDYKASTIGISTTCHFIDPAACGMVLWDDYYSNVSFPCVYFASEIALLNLSL